MIFDILNSLGRVILTGLVVYKLTQYRDMANMVERIGLGLMGGCSFLTVGVIWERDGPFEGWASTVMTVGVVLYIGGRTYRDRKHDIANHLASAEALRYLKSKGKL